MSETSRRAESEPKESDSSSETDDRFRLKAEVEILREENETLRDEYARVRHVRNRNAALGLAAVGLVALGGAALLPSVRTVLLVLGATGLFTATLVYSLEPTRVLPVSASEAVYDALAENESALASELGLKSGRYVPTDASGTPSVVLFVTANDDGPSLPDSSSLLVVSNGTDGHGVALSPTGMSLLDSVRGSMPDGFGETPEDLAGSLSDAAEALDIVEAASATVVADENRLAVGVSGYAYGSLDRFDHPVVSVFAVGLAAAMDEPVRVESIEPSDRADAVIDYRWGE
ncbi:hypothetical protein [Haladaptatus sp. AB643]|uniref:hypothetical protein n=1 Tax=Haladaptatus sp. AB643 TaxID=2934174 RepID=UPI00209C4DD7|nr:hypothetical protein [Haladaptatus sp. AB643]MCO8246683.1 hypothetical protein [Haladaptatus sp. AB643]